MRASVLAPALATLAAACGGRTDASAAATAASNPAPPSAQPALQPRAKVAALRQAAAAAGASVPPATARKARALSNMVLISGTAAPALSDEIAYELQTPLVKVDLQRFADGEIGVQILESVRGKDVYIVQPTCFPANETVMELFLLVTTLRRAQAGRITAVIPSFGYKRANGDSSTLVHQTRSEAVARTDSASVQGIKEELLWTVGADAAGAGGDGSVETLMAALSSASKSSSEALDEASNYSASLAAGSATSVAVPAPRTRVEDLAVLARWAAKSTRGTSGPYAPGGAAHVQPLPDAGVPAAGTTTSSPASPSAPPAAGGVDSVEPASVSRVYPVTAADVALMLETAGIDAVITVDLQPPGSGQIDGFFSRPVENLRASRIALDHISKLKNLRDPVTVIAPHERCIAMAHDFRVGLERRWGGKKVGFGVVVESAPSHHQEAHAHHGAGSGAAAAHGHGPCPHCACGCTGSTTASASGSSAAGRLELVGEVAGHDVILVLDVLDTGASLTRRVEALKALGARRIICYATHGLFNGSALQRITRSAISEVFVTNTVPLRESEVDIRHAHKIAQLSVAPLVAEAILRMQTGDSLVDLRVGEAGVEARYVGQETETA